MGGVGRQNETWPVLGGLQLNEHLTPGHVIMPPHPSGSVWPQVGNPLHFVGVHIVVVVVLVDVVVVVLVVVVVVVPRIGQLAGAGAIRARNRSPSSLPIVPPKKPQKRTPPTSMMMPTPPCGVLPSGYAASPRAESRMERPALSRAEMTAPERLLNL